MTALMMLGLWFGWSGRPRWGAGSIALGALAKPIAVFAFPAIWRPWDWKLPLVIMAVVALCYVPYLSAGWGAFGFLAQGYLAEEQIVSGDHIWPLVAWRFVVGTWRGDVVVYFLMGAAFVAALSFKTAFRSHRSITTQLADINWLLLAGLFVLSPNYPWYFLAATPFVALQGGAPVWAMTLGALLLQEEAGWGQFIPLLLRKSLLYGAFIAACLHWFWLMRSPMWLQPNEQNENVNSR